jgi:adenine deaminase
MVGPIPDEYQEKLMKPIDNTLLQVALGKKPADRVIMNGKIVDVFSREIYKGGIAISGTKIAGVGDVEQTIGTSTEVMDAHGYHLVPGLIDGHVHIESSMLDITHFAEMAIRHGTTSVMTDLHEVAVVGGLEALKEVLDEAKGLPFKVFFVVPSHVPFSPGFETTGGLIGPDEVKIALQFPHAVGLSEIVVTAALAEDARLWRSMQITRDAGLSLHGHSPFVNGAQLSAFASLGIRTDHESFTLEDAIQRLRAGIHLLIRDGSTAEGIPDLIRTITERGLDSHRISVITDDYLAQDLVSKGYMDAVYLRLLKHHVDPMTSIQLISINAAEAYRVDDEIGALAPGREADILLVEDLNTFKIHQVFSCGKLVAEDGQLIQPFPPPSQSKIHMNSIHVLKPVTVLDFEKLAMHPSGQGEVNIHVLVTPEEIPVPELGIFKVKVLRGVIQPDPQQDIAASCVVERHTANGNVSLAFIKGFRLKQGAIASSVAHDHHNIIGLGTNYEDLACAIQRVIELQGGQVVVRDGKVVAEIPLPILGLMSSEPANWVCERIKELGTAALQIGCGMRWPLMFLSFMSCSSGPGYSITDKGLLDGFNQCFLPIVAD